MGRVARETELSESGGGPDRGADLAEQRRRLPDAPGVYIFTDDEGRVVYVGKSLSIRKRVANHFSSRSTLGALADRIVSIDFLVTETEAEALLTEQQFIKRHRPLLNVKLRDDKSYPYIGISLDEEFPRVYFTRERHRPSRTYFGPYATARRVRETLELLGKLFQYRTCEGAEPGRRSGVPCLDYYIKRCGAPCVGYIDREEYMRSIESIRRFLGGRYRDVERDLEEKMEQASVDQEFERAALFRDRLTAVRSLMERQKVAGESVGTADLIGVAVEGSDANAQLFQVRDGVLAERQGFYLDNKGERGIEEVAEQFLAQYYEAAPTVPPLVVVGPELAARAGVLAEALGSGAERRSRCARPSVATSAGCASSPSATRSSPSPRTGCARSAVGRSARRLCRSSPTRSAWMRSRSGSRATTSPTSAPSTPSPRWSSSRAVRRRRPTTGASTSAAAKVAAGPTTSPRSRRCSPAGSRGSSPPSDLSPHDAELDESFAALPSLIMIDGGKGQLSAGIRALQPLLERGVHRHLAREAARGGLRAGQLPAAADHAQTRRPRACLQRVRDEAHRFALEGHRRRRGKAMTTSVLDDLPGIGPARKRALLGHFGSPERVLSASREELEAVPGIPGKLAREIHGRINKTG